MPDTTVVIERINTPYTSEHFVAFCEKMLDQPYWYGSVVYKCTESLRKRKAKQYPSHYKDNRTARYRDDISKNKVCADCVGLIKGYQWSYAGEGVIESIGTDKTFKSKYGNHGCPDKSANGMFTYAKSKGMAWGTIDTIPEIPGITVRFDGHVGVYVGNGYVIEERGFSYGCVKTRLKDRKWLHWYQLPFVDYGDAFDDVSTSPGSTVTVVATLGARLLKKGMKGQDVIALQELLLQLGYKLPKYGADGDFGSETETAVKAFQKKIGVKVDGKYGDETHAALMDAVADDDEGKDESSDADDESPDNGDTSDTTVDQPDETDTPTTDTTIPAIKTVLIKADNGGKINIRVGNDTKYGRITTVASGTTLPYVATAENGWHAVLLSDRIGWVSGKYSQVA